MLKKIVIVILLVGIGVVVGKFGFGSTTEKVMPSPNALYKNSGEGTASLLAEKDFKGAILEVKNGDLIMDAVRKAAPGDLIRVYPGTYKETVYIDKDDISFQGVIKDGEWPVLDGAKELNDAFLYSGNGIQIENFKIINYKGNGIMGQAGNNFVLRNNWIIDAGVYGIFPQFGKNGL